MDLLITDIVMPGMNGIDLARTLTKRMPQLRVIFTSGYSHEAIARYGAVPQGAFLDKPYAPFELVASVQRVLAG